MPKAAQDQAIASLTHEQAQAMLFDWEFWARPEQLLPLGDWAIWLILAGRGFGKTRIGSETVRCWIQQGFRYVNVIGPTSDAVRDDLVEGPSGILAVCRPDERPYYRTSKSRLEWPNGARTLLLSADEPDRIRGKNSEKVWMDELAAWRYLVDAYDQAMFGLRIGKSPQAVITTTPRPLPIIRELIADKSCIVSRGTTYDNAENLSARFYAKIIGKYEGTRLGRQELNAEVLDDNPRALWSRDLIERGRVKLAPNLARIVVGLDPNVKNRDHAELRRGGADVLDEAGIVVAGSTYIDDVEHYFVLGDYSLDEGPNEWGKAAVKAYDVHNADRIIGEVNNGGDMVEATIRAVDGAANVGYKSVTASRGKAIRAEPISALYEQGRVHHVGMFAQLEDEMCQFDPVTTVKSPNRMDALVWALTELSDGASSGLLSWTREKAASMREGERPTYSTPTDTVGIH